jgi:uncharacterized protein DUF3500
MTATSPRPDGGGPPGAERLSVGSAMSQAAAAWRDGLDEEQRAVGVWDWASGCTEAERLRWFYTPTDHGGLTIHQMAPAQQRAAMRLLATGLSNAAYVTASSIMGLENVLDRLEGWQIGFARDRGRDPGMYYVRVFGNPTGDGPWAWRFGGHHVSVHHLLVDGAVVASTPCFLGSDPAVSPLLGGRELRLLGGVEDLARELLHSLDPDHRARAVVTEVPPVDIVAGNRVHIPEGAALIPLPDLWRGHFSDTAIEDRLWSMHHQGRAMLHTTAVDDSTVALTAAPKGLAAREMTSGSRDVLRALLDTYVGRAPDELVASERARFDETVLDDVHFAWAGGAERGQPHYYRLQGPRLLAEWDNTQRDVNHAHSVWRDPGHDFGLDVLARHRSHHHDDPPR